ncbi:OmpH family outer membrane protein [Pseudoalteromonas sp. SSM20]|uniref:OmpH family outer membrane protein n=1 Tax=Pseudoalteromonas sp. SSM20 TaxID=3139394 RepID=UPI003BA8D3EF
MNKMIKTTAMTLLATFLMGASASSFAHKVAIVNVQQVFSGAPQAAAIKATLESEFRERRQELEKLQGDIRFEVEKYQRENATMSKAQKEAHQKKIQELQKALQEKGQPLQQEMQMRQAQETKKLESIIFQAIEAEAKEGKYDEVKPAAASLYVNEKKVDNITDKVAERVAKAN